MKRVLLTLLRLLLQLLLFALTGTWHRLRGLESPPAIPPRKQQRKKPRGVPRPPRAEPRRPRDGRGQRAPAYEVEWEGAVDQTSLEVLLGGPEGGVVAPKRRAKVRPVIASSDVRPTVGGVLRSRAGLRDAILLDAALGTRRTRR